MRFLIKIVLMALVLSLPLLANSVATITALKGSVKIKNESIIINATLGAKLNEKDNIVTADKSKAQIIFNDETIVTIGKNSYFSISKYIFDESKEPVAEFSVLKGAMKAITGRIGKIAPQKFKVKTKTATIGIRGTNFTIISMEDGSMHAYCTYGAISVSVNGASYGVAQGFYLTLSPDGKVSISEFSAGELKDMNDNSFGRKQPLVGKADQGDEPDNTVEVIEGVLIRDVSEQVQDGVQTNKVQKDDEFVNTISYHGWSVDDDLATSMTFPYPKVNLEFAEDGSSFNSENSWVEVLSKYNAAGEKDNWTFYIKETPDYYESKNEFTTSFSSVYLESTDPTNPSSSKNPQIVSSDFHTKPDLSSDDYMSWGVWNADVTYEYDSLSELMSSSVTAQDEHTFMGLWVAGEATSADVISARTDSVYYIGEYKALVNGSNQLESGSADLYVDFGRESAYLTISDNANDGGSINSTYTYHDMSVSGHTINGGTIGGGTSDSVTGTANGTFYGPNGSALGGNFSINDGAVSVKGVYQVEEEVQYDEYSLPLSK